MNHYRFKVSGQAYDVRVAVNAIEMLLEGFNHPYELGARERIPEAGPVSIESDYTTDRPFLPFLFMALNFVRGTEVEEVPSPDAEPVLRK